MSINAANAAIVGATSCVGAAPPAADALAATMARRDVAAIYAAALNRITLTAAVLEQGLQCFVICFVLLQL